MWPAYRSCLQKEGHDYYFSIDEILAVADAVGANVAIYRMEQCVADLVACSEHLTGERALLWCTGGTRGHFERLVSLDLVTQSVFPHACEHAVSEFWRSIATGLDGHVFDWRLPSSIHLYIFGVNAQVLDLWIAFQDQKWKSAFEALPQFARGHVLEFRPAWFASECVSLLKLFFDDLEQHRSNTKVHLTERCTRRRVR